MEPSKPAFKERFFKGFLLLVVTLQIAIPFVRKFNLPNFRYHYALFSWAMYSKPALIYELSLFRITESGTEAIPNIKKYVREYSSPQAFRLSDYYRSVEEIQNWHEALVKAIAHREKDGRIYGASIHWVRKFNPASPDNWKFQTLAQGNS